VRTISLHLLADLLLCLSATAAPVPRDGPPELAGVWCYSWNGTPGVVHLNPDGSYLALHGECKHEYAGAWWRGRDGRVIVSEYRCGESGQQISPPVRYEFALRRVGTGWEMVASTGLVVKLTRPNN
jgi:hypothetical protein